MCSSKPGGSSPARSPSTGALKLHNRTRRDLLDGEAFAKLLGSRGISNRHLVVLDGDHNNWFAAYTYWALVYHGHESVKLLNGSRERWVVDRPRSRGI